MFLFLIVHDNLSLFPMCVFTYRNQFYSEKVSHTYVPQLFQSPDRGELENLCIESYAARSCVRYFRVTPATGQLSSW
jgi:hypothetical protein